MQDKNFIIMHNNTLLRERKYFYTYIRIYTLLSMTEANTVEKKGACLFKKKRKRSVT